jgi:hypothetical protein
MVGQDGEIFIDTDKNVPVIQDGITPGGHPLISEEYLLENSLPPKIGFDKSYLIVENGESIWKELSLLPAGSVTAVPQDLVLPESSFVKLDGSIKLKSDYPGLAELFEGIPLANVVTTETSNFLSHYSFGEVSGDFAPSQFENMVFDGTYYVRILGQDDPNYNTYYNDMTPTVDSPYDIDGPPIYPEERPNYPIYVDGTQFKIQRSLDGINWTTITVAPFSNNATRCKYISASLDGVIYMLVDRSFNIDYNTTPPVWNPTIQYIYDSGTNTWVQYNAYEYVLVANTTIGLPPDQTNTWSRGSSTIQKNYSSLLVKSTNHGSTWQNVSLGQYNTELNTEQNIRKVKYVEPRKTNPTNLVSWQANTNYSLNAKIYYKDVIYTVSNIDGNPATAVTGSSAPTHRSSSVINGSYTLTFQEFYDRGALLLFGSSGLFISIDLGQTFTKLDNVYPSYYSQNVSGSDIIETSSGVLIYDDTTIERTPGMPEYYIQFYSIYQDLLQNPEAIDPQLSTEVGMYYFKSNVGNTTKIVLPSQHLPAASTAFGYEYKAEPAGCYNPETDQFIYAYTHNKETLVLLSIDSTNSVDSSFTLPTENEYGQTTIKTNFYSKIITSPDFDPRIPYVDARFEDYKTYRYVGIQKLHWSPLFGIMVFMKNKIYYSEDPKSLKWNIVANLPTNKNYHFSSCVNTADGVLVSCRDEVIFIKFSDDAFVLPIIEDDNSLSYSTSYYIKT